MEVEGAERGEEGQDDEEEGEQDSDHRGACHQQQLIAQGNQIVWIGNIPRTLN